MSGAYLSTGEPVDLDNCHREPIHIPGSIQPHGCLLAIDPATLEVIVASANCADFFGTGPEAAVGVRARARSSAMTRPARSAPPRAARSAARPSCRWARASTRSCTTATARSSPSSCASRAAPAR